jgi:hypothetical protein
LRGVDWIKLAINICIKKEKGGIICPVEGLGFII